MPLLAGRRLVCTLVASALVLAVVLAPAAAGAPSPWKQSVKIKLSSNRAAKPFGGVFVFQLVDTRCGRVACPRSPDAERPKNAAKIEVQLPRGTRYSPKGSPLCPYWEATEKGPCGGEALLGTGSVSYNFNPFISPDFEFKTGRLWVVHAQGGVRDPERPQEELLGYGLGFFMALAPELGPEGRYAFPARVTPRGLITITMPERVAVFGQPGSLTGLAFRIRKNAQLNGTPLLRTPRRCNPDNGWRIKTVVTYEDDSTKTLFTRHPCFRRR